MKKLLLISVSLMLVGCNGLKRLTEGREHTVNTVPDNSANLPAPSTALYGDPTPFTEATALPTAPVGNVTTIAGLLPDPYTNTFNVSTMTVTTHLGYVRNTADGKWYTMAYGGGLFGSAPRYAFITDGVTIKKTYGEYDAICIYLVR